jgi:hypothetical protein
MDIGQLNINRRHDGGNEQEQTQEDPNFDRKLDLITAGASPFVKEHLLTKISRENCQVIINYVMAFMAEVNPSERYSQWMVYQKK